MLTATVKEKLLSYEEKLFGKIFATLKSLPDKFVKKLKVLYS